MYVRISGRNMYVYAQDHFPSYHMKYCKVLQGTPQTQYSLVSYSQGHIHTYVPPCLVFSVDLRIAWTCHWPAVPSVSAPWLTPSLEIQSVFQREQRIVCICTYLCMDCTPSHTGPPSGWNPLTQPTATGTQAQWCACMSYLLQTYSLLKHRTYVCACVREDTHPPHTHTHPNTALNALMHMCTCVHIPHASSVTA